jgi:hypothetical protein
VITKSVNKKANTSSPSPYTKKEISYIWDWAIYVGEQAEKDRINKKKNGT